MTNRAGQTLENVVIEDQVPASFSFESATPKPSTESKTQLIWNLGNLGANASRVISVTGKPTSTASLAQCVRATFQTEVCSTIPVVEPQLKLTKSAPAKVLLCDSIPMQFVVTNPGTGEANGVKITDTLPAGLKTADGQSNITIDVGDLGAGQSRNYTVVTRASKINRYTNSASAGSTRGLKTDSNNTVTEVVQPILKVSNTSRKEQLLGRPVTFDITVFNSGNGISDNTMLKAQLPTNARLLKTSAGTVTGSELSWSVGSLAPEQNMSVSVTMMPDGISTLNSTATVSGVCADATQAATATKVIGIPAILLEVIDVNDPVEVGGQETYIITATNQGTSNGTNVTVAVSLEDTMQFVSASGDSAGTHQAGKVQFAPYPSLAPNARATWKVVVKAVKEGDVRFGVSMTSDQFTRPVSETEATNFYK